MSKLALYRKYRSADLNELVGQEHITKTIEASLKNGNISHAYLFSGPRGVGKTSTARILARKVNSIDSNRDLNEFLDIIEIDAASNRGIDDVRSLREKLNSAPTSLEYKVIIIDEVHMLTKEAFNALLKTLEEPPEHVLFILATTESHKIPATIISRTQHYEFRPFSEDQIANHLKSICTQEKIMAEPSGLQSIASLAGGSMRDAIGILDQLAPLADVIDDATVQKLIGLSSTIQLEEVHTNILLGDSQKCLATINNLVSSGVEPTMLCNQLQRFFRDKIVSGDNNDNHYIFAIEKLIEANERFKYTPVKSLPLEIAVVKIAQRLSSESTNKFVNHDRTKENDSVHMNSDDRKSKLTYTEPSQKKPNQKVEDRSKQCVKGLSLIKEHNNSLYALLKSGNAHIENDKLLVDCRFNFHKQRIEEPRNREFIEKIMSKVCEVPIQLKCNIKSIDTNENKVDSSKEVITSAMAILGGEIIDG